MVADDQPLRVELNPLERFLVGRELHRALAELAATRAADGTHAPPADAGFELDRRGLIVRLSAIDGVLRTLVAADHTWAGDRVPGLLDFVADQLRAAAAARRPVE